MTDHGRGGKPKTGFPPRPQSLEIAHYAISTFPQSRRGAEKWKTKITFPTFPLAVCMFKRKNRKEPGSRFAPPSGSFFNEKMLYQHRALSQNCLKLSQNVALRAIAAGNLVGGGSSAEMSMTSMC
jgi:hypothetical protein